MKNVVVIVTDSLRFDYLGAYGNERVKTPNFDRLARESCLFSRAYSEGVPTLPARLAWFTGRYTFAFGKGWPNPEPGDVLLAEVLWDKGWETALICDTYHMHKPGMTFCRGFDYVEWIRGQEGDPYIVDPSIKVDVDRYFKPRPQEDQKWRNKQVREQLEQYLRNTSHWRGEEDHFVAQVMKAGMRWLEKVWKGRRPFFLWLDSFDPHEPWDPPEEYRNLYADPNYKGVELIHPVPGEVEGYLSPEEEEHIRALYAGEVTLVDKWVGEFVNFLKEKGLLDDTLLIWTSDHGEPLGRGEHGHGIIRKARPWPYEELSHIPLLIRHPEGVGAGRRIDSFVETVDIMPTILDFLGVEGPKWMHGKSLLPLMRGEVEKLRDFAVSGYPGRSWSIRDDEWTLILWLPQRPKRMDETPWTLGGTLEMPKRPELYHRKTDPYELRNVIDDHPEEAERLELALRRLAASLV